MLPTLAVKPAATLIPFVAVTVIALKLEALFAKLTVSKVGDAPAVVVKVTVPLMLALFVALIPSTVMPVLLPAIKIKFAAVIFCNSVPLMVIVPAVAPKPMLPVAVIVVLPAPLVIAPVLTNAKSVALILILLPPDVIVIPLLTVTVPPTATKLIVPPFEFIAPATVILPLALLLVIVMLPPVSLMAFNVNVAALSTKLTLPLVVLVAVKLVTVFALPKVVPVAELVVKSAPLMNPVAPSVTAPAVAVNETLPEVLLILPPLIVRVRPAVKLIAPVAVILLVIDRSLVAPDVVTVKLANGELPPTAAPNETVPVPAVIISPCGPFNVFVNDTLLFVVDKVVTLPAPNVTTPL